MAERLRLHKQDRVLDDLVDVKPGHLWCRILGEVPDPADDIACPIGVADDSFHRAPRLLNFRDIAIQPPKAGVPVGDDTDKRLTYLVRDRGAQLAKSGDACGAR